MARDQGRVFGVQDGNLFGLPLYLLANWRAEAPADPHWMRALPSRLLNARREVVPFTGRETELVDLRSRRDESPRLVH